MNHPTVVTLAISFFVVLAGCTTSYRETLDQKLAGKSPNDRRTILAQECVQEIQKGLKLENDENVKHFEKMKRICEEMTGKPINVSFSK